MLSKLQPNQFSKNVSQLRKWGLSAQCIATLVGSQHTENVYNWEKGSISTRPIQQLVALVAKIGAEVEEKTGSAYIPLFLYSHSFALRDKTPVDIIKSEGERGMQKVRVAAKDFVDTVVFTDPPPYPAWLTQIGIKPVIEKKDKTDKAYRKCCVAIMELEKFFPSLHEIGVFLSISGGRVLELKSRRGASVTLTQLAQLEKTLEIAKRLVKRYRYDRVGDVMLVTSRQHCQAGLSIAEHIARDIRAASGQDVNSQHLESTVATLLD